MDTKPKNVREKLDVDKHLVDNGWEDKSRGLRKEVVDFKFDSIVKASDLSRCLVEVLEVNNLNPDVHKSNYLQNIEEEFWLVMGHALTAIDCYVEEFLKQMLTNETSKCLITTKSSGVIDFTVKMKKIEFGGYYCEQPAQKMFELAKSYKENGVQMFKEFPLFAHNYFNLAAKCLLSFNPFDETNVSTDSTLKKSDFLELLQSIYLNIAACLVKENRYDDILHVLSYTITQDNPSEKAVYRLALAYFHLKEFDSAKNTIERINYKNNKDLVQLMAKILEHWKVDNDKYSSMVKKMFG